MKSNSSHLSQILCRVTHGLKSTNIKALLCLDFILLPLALITAILLRLGGNWDVRLNHFWWLFLALPLWTIPIFIHLGLYRAIIKYFDEKLVAIALYGVSLSVLILIMVVHFARIDALPKTSMIIFWVFALAYIGGTRLILRGIARKVEPKNNYNIALYGAGTAGIQLCLALQNSRNYNIVAFFDDDAQKWGTTIRGITIYNPARLATIVAESQIKQVLIAMPSVSQSRRQQIIYAIEPLSVQIRTLPGISDLVSGEVTVNDIKEIDIEDLLGRTPIPPDIALLKKNIYTKNVLVTGAGGTIGGELAKQSARLAPNTLVLFDISEYALYNIHRELQTKFPYVQLVTVLGSVTDNILVENTLKQYRINTIYHAAAYKHVPLVQCNQVVGIYNNSIGTYVVAKAALKYGVDIMVLISTDKAVRPTNVMGASKRLAEMILQAFNSKTTHTIFTMVRFGNVLGSSGSVVPLFREQIKQGGPITITHPDIIRYFMTITEAVELVIQASNMASGGEVFVLDMGEPVKITALATRMVHLSGLTLKSAENPAGDIEFVFTGLRPGEKLYEELLISNNPAPTKHPRIMQAQEDFLAYAELSGKLEQLSTAISGYDVTVINTIMHELVTHYDASK